MFFDRLVIVNDAGVNQRPNSNVETRKFAIVRSCDSACFTVHLLDRDSLGNNIHVTRMEKYVTVLEHSAISLALAFCIIWSLVIENDSLIGF